MEQLVLWDEPTSDRKLNVFTANYCNEDWTTATAGKGKIVQSFSFKVNKKELKSICRNAVKIERPLQYGYSVFYINSGVKIEIFVRFMNFKTSKKKSIFEHIDLYFDKEWEWLNKDSDNNFLFI